MTLEESNWRELCRAIANEQDSEKLANLVQKLIAVLDERKSANALTVPEVDRCSTITTKN